jgi:hypothetical protein
LPQGVREKEDFLFRSGSSMSNHDLTVSSSLIDVNLSQEINCAQRAELLSGQVARAKNLPACPP